MLSDLRAFDLLTDAYLVLDDEYRVVAANERYCGLTKQPATAVLGRSIYEINQHASQTAREQREMTLTTLFARLRSVELAETSPLRYPLPSDPSDTSDRYWKLFGSRRQIVNNAGVPENRFILRLQDVTSSHLHEIEQRKQQAMLRSTAQLRQRLVVDAQRRAEQDNDALKEALAFARIGAWILDLDTGIIDCTAQCKANYGMSDDYLMTHDSLLNELIDPADRPRVRAVLEAALQRRGSFDVEYRTIHPSGETRWIMIRGKMTEGDAEATPRLSGFSLDITERKVWELENEARMKLEVDARRASEDRINAMDSFVSAVSHELRSPLNAIGSWAQLLDRPDQIALPRAADVIKRNVRQLGLMIEDLLDTGAVINGQFHVALQAVDLSQIATSVLEDARLNIEAKGLVLKTDIAPRCAISGDETRLRQVIFNLLTNAIKFTDRGEISATLTSNETSIRFALQDSGIGISVASQGKIFGRFTQALEAGAKRHSGLGLGLWIAHTIVTAHHGTLHVESAGPGQGATFIMTLPRSSDPGVLG